jgi:hypothetical protein
MKNGSYCFDAKIAPRKKGPAGFPTGPIQIGNQ